MGQISVTLNGRTYRLRCEDGEEERLFALGSHVRAHIDRLTREHGQIGDERLLLMAAILVTDELFDARERAAPREPGDETGTPAIEASANSPRPPLPKPEGTKPEIKPREALAPVAASTDSTDGSATKAAAARAGTTSPTGAAPKPAEALDSTALMRGLDRKLART